MTDRPQRGMLSVLAIVGTLAADAEPRSADVADAPTEQNPGVAGKEESFPERSGRMVDPGRAVSTTGGGACAGAPRLTAIYASPQARQSVSVL